MAQCWPNPLLYLGLLFNLSPAVCFLCSSGFSFGENISGIGYNLNKGTEDLGAKISFFKQYERFSQVRFGQRSA